MVDEESFQRDKRILNLYSALNTLACSCHALSYNMKKKCFVVNCLAFCLDCFLGLVGVN